MYTILWEYEVPPQFRDEFERVYGRAGEWVLFFRSGQGYLETVLLRDADTRGRYVTIDGWESKRAYDAFRSERLAEYNSIDQRCEGLTLRETHLGSFELVPETSST